MKPEIGITPEHLAGTAHALTNLLADEFLLYMKTLNAHWNVEGTDFYNKHLFFEKQYGELFEIIDQVAERIRSLGHYAPATLRELLQLTHITEQSRSNNNATAFIQLLLADHESIIIHLREQIDQFVNELKDAGTSDFITALLEKHEKMAWMLRANLIQK